MDIIRRNTDYAMRLMVNLAMHFDYGFISSRILSEEEDVSRHLSCKLLQKLNAAGLVRSTMGANGGYSLSKTPSEINLSNVIDVIQGPLAINRCFLSKDACPRQTTCPITQKLKGLQSYLTESLSSITFADLVKALSKEQQVETGGIKTGTNKSILSK